jgi:hypothetical protein
MGHPAKKVKGDPPLKHSLETLALGGVLSLLRKLVLLIAVVALALSAAVTLRRAKPKSLAGPPIRGALRVARLMHAGDWNVAPQAIPNLTGALHTLGFGVPVTQKDLFASDPNLIY